MSDPGKTNPKKCPDCLGLGIIKSFHGELSTSGNGIEPSSLGYTLCPRCRGMGLVGVRGLESLTQKEIAHVVEGRNFDSLFEMFNHKTPEELNLILSEIMQSVAVT